MKSVTIPCPLPFFCFLLLCLSVLSDPLAAQNIDNYAGLGGNSGYTGDGGPAILARIFYPYRIAVAGNGDVYFTDMGNNVIRKISTTGIITTIAGNGTYGYSGDGGPATAARLNQPTALAFDQTDNLYICDYLNSVIRKVSPAGIITTVAGNKTEGFSGDGGQATLAQLYRPVDIAVDAAGNLFIADNSNRRVRKVSPSGIISTVAGNGTAGYTGDGGLATAAQFTSTTGLATDKVGNLYISDSYHSVIRKVSPAGIITTIAGNGTYGYSGDGGPATAAQFTVNSPDGIAVDAAGNLYAADYQNHVIRKIDPQGIITTVAGTGTAGISGNGGPATAAPLWFPIGVAVDHCNNLFITDTYNNTLRKVTDADRPSFTAQPSAQTVCPNTLTAFTVEAPDALRYQWLVNTGSGWTAITDNATYTGANTNHLQLTAGLSLNGYQYRCAIANACNNALSDAAHLSVTNAAQPQLGITASATTICSGSSITFTATASSGGDAPRYQWKKNGNNTSTNSPVYTETNLADGDRITCILTATNSCAAVKEVSSNEITISVKPLVTPSIAITASADPICQGTSLQLNAAASGGGTTPAYQWLKNGAAVGTNSATYSDNAFSNGDVVQCTLTSSAACLSTPTTASNAMTINVITALVPAIQITTNTTSICEGTPVRFQASVVNGGSAPTFQWKKNDQPVGTNQDTYTDAAITNNDVITCEVISTGTCLAFPKAVSNAATITVHSRPRLSLPTVANLCQGSSIILDPGVFASYQWNNGSRDRFLKVENAGLYAVTVNDNNCSASDTSLVRFAPAPSGFLPADTAICSGSAISLTAPLGYASYLWNTNASATNLEVSQPGVYWLEVEDASSGCKGRDSVSVRVKTCTSGMYIPSAFTPDNNGRNDVFKPLFSGNLEHFRFAVYNRWGQLVFATTNPSKGWDGTLGSQKLESNVFVWICTYRLKGEAGKTEKGTVLLIR